VNDPAAALRAALRFANRDLAPSVERVDGRTLALYRVAAGVRPFEVARALDSNRQYVFSLETDGAIVSTAGRYRAAVDLVAAERAEAERAERADRNARYVAAHAGTYKAGE